MNTKKTNEKRIPFWKKMFVVVVAFAMVMMMNNTAFAAVHVRGSHMSTLYSRSSYAEGSTSTGLTGLRCLVIVTAFNSSGSGETNYADDIGSAYTFSNASGGYCDHATSYHRVYETSPSGSITYYEHNLQD